jgi:nucleosome binding factor SPN SPT16 subunit
VCGFGLQYAAYARNRDSRKSSALSTNLGKYLPCLLFGLDLEMEVNEDRFLSRLQLLVEGVRDQCWASSLQAPVIIVAGAADADSPYHKSHALHIWLLGMELHDSILAIHANKVVFLASNKKADIVRNLSGAAAKKGLTLEVLNRTKADNDAANFAALLEDILASGCPVGTLKKAKEQGDFSAAFMNALSESKIEQVDVSEKISQCISVKDEEEVALITTAGKGCSHVMKRLFKRIVKVTEDSTKVSHLKLSEEFGGLLPDISAKVASGEKGDYEEAYMPIIQSGEQMNVRISAQCDEKPLFLATSAKHSGIIFSSIGVRYQTFCANMARTFLVNPTESQKRYYTALEASLAAGIASCIVNNTFGQVFDAIVGVLSQTKDDSGNALDAAMFKIVGFGIGYELREAPLLIQKDASFQLKQGCTIALYIGLENLVSKDVVKGLSTCSMQIGDTLVVGSSSPTVVTRDAMDTKISSVEIVFDDEESEEDTKVRESKKPKREAVESVAAVSDRRSKVGRGTEDNTKHKLKIEQDQLLIQKNRIAERTGQLSGEGKKSHKTKASEAAETFVSYKSSDVVPRSADANRIHADLDNSTVIFPVLGTSVVIHASNIKGAVKDKSANVVRAQFNLPTNIPGTTAFIKELSYRFPDATSATASLKKITDLKRKFTSQIQEKKDLESLTEQAAVRILRGSVRPHALRGIRYWPTIGRKVKQKGDLELHENGLKFICQATRTEFEFVFSNVQYAFFQKAGRSYREVCTFKWLMLRA